MSRGGGGEKMSLEELQLLIVTNTTLSLFGFLSQSMLSNAEGDNVGFQPQRQGLHRLKQTGMWRHGTDMLLKGKIGDGES